jgi:hypothetical protein
MKNNLRFRNKNRSQCYEEAVKILHRLAKEESVDSVTEAYAEATSAEWNKIYSEVNEVTQSQGQACLSPLLNGNRCKKTVHTVDEDCFPPACDHHKLWKKGKVYTVFTSEPYSLSYENLKDTVKYCEANGLRADINTFSPYYPGKTLLVQFRKKS